MITPAMREAAARALIERSAPIPLEDLDAALEEAERAREEETLAEIKGLRGTKAMTPMEQGNQEKYPLVPTNEFDLLVEALRLADRVSGLLNDIDAAVLKRIKSDADHRFDDIFDLLLRRFSDCSGVHLFIAANNIGIDLPPDLRGDPDGDGDDE
jgi:hypothetical protein